MTGPDSPPPPPGPGRGEDFAAYVRKVVDRAPPLTSEQRARLAALLAPGKPIVERRVA